MLIGFSVENHRSFKEAASLVSIDESKNPVKLSLLFGANNSGKTNFLRAIETMSSMVRFGLSCWLPFKMTEESKNEPAFFEIVILAESGDRIQYGFEIKDDCIKDEWLHKYSVSDDTDTPIILFERDCLGVSESFQIGLSNTELFLAQASIVESNTVQEFFNSTYVAFSTNKNYLDKDILDFVNNSSTLKPRLYELMSKIDLPIPDPILGLPTSKGFDEAFGFLNLVLFAEAKKIKLLAIDSFGENLHPLLASELINIAKSISGLQLIISTHQTRLMDEVSPWAIWLVEKDDKQSSTLTGLVEYKLKPDGISRKYLNGLYGGIPFVTIGEFVNK
jgi:AAA15 family ATPase/GTPase